MFFTVVPKDGQHRMHRICKQCVAVQARHCSVKNIWTAEQMTLVSCASLCSKIPDMQIFATTFGVLCLLTRWKSCILGMRYHFFLHRAKSHLALHVEQQVVGMEKSHDCRCNKEKKDIFTMDIAWRTIVTNGLKWIGFQVEGWALLKCCCLLTLKKIKMLPLPLVLYLGYR